MNVNALLVFCEGPHDVAFTRMIFRKVLKFRKLELKFSEMPAPLNNLFATAVEKHAAKDLALHMAHKFFLPDTVLQLDTHFVLLFNCGGNSKHESIKTFLSDFLPLLKNAQIFPDEAKHIVSSAKYLFLNDADQEGINTIALKLTQEFANIDGEDFLSTDWQTDTFTFGRIAENKALYVLADTPNQGTLEDILYPLFCHEDPTAELVETAETTLTQMFSWKTNQEHEQFIAERARLKKAVLTTVGQRKKPGSSLAVILEQSKQINTQALKQSQKTQDFVKFIQAFGDINT